MPSIVFEHTLIVHTLSYHFSLDCIKMFISLTDLECQMPVLALIFNSVSMSLLFLQPCIYSFIFSACALYGLLGRDGRRWM